MEAKQKKLNATRKRRVMRIRKHLRGDSVKPRLSVFRSAKHIYAQLIDDESGKTLVSASSLKLDSAKDRKKAAKETGIAIAKKAKDVKIEKARFDKGPYKYHGLIALLADGAREGGLQF